MLGCLSRSINYKNVVVFVNTRTNTKTRAYQCTITLVRMYYSTSTQEKKQNEKRNATNMNEQHTYKCPKCGEIKYWSISEQSASRGDYFLYGEEYRFLCAGNYDTCNYPMVLVKSHTTLEFIEAEQLPEQPASVGSIAV